ncbi:MAG TPA: YoaK family protein [Lysobacter sp.]
MIGRLPRWVWPVAWWLAFVAGGVNAIGLLGVAHQAVSHLTGTTTLLADALATGAGGPPSHLAAIVAAFVLGAAAGGAVVPADPLSTGQRHTAVLLACAASLLAAWRLFPAHPAAALGCAAFACGLQNATTTAYSGAVVRTSHVSGMFTDLGISLGQAVRGGAVGRRRIALCCTVIAGFFGGGLATARLFVAVGYDALLLPVAVLAMLATANALHAAASRRDAH